MKFAKRLFVFCPAAVILIAAFYAAGQTTRPDFNRPQTFDALNYTIRASFDRSNKKVFGDTTVSLKPLKSDFRTVELDAVDFTFDTVKLEPAGTPLQFKTTGKNITITLDRAYGPAETISIRLKYTVSPKKGVYFVGRDSDNKGAQTHSDQIWSQGEADEARHWFPSFDFPSDKATTEEYITAEKGETVIGNGEFLGKEDTADGKVTWHYKMAVPHSTYLVSFVIGKYVRVDDKYKDTPLGFYVYPGRESTARKAFGDTKTMIGVYEALTGVAFPYNKYDQTVVANFQFGGMENITATTMNDSDIFFVEFDFGKATVTDLVSHELAHSWFGDLVTCRNWAELWLNEGFATYMEAAYREQIYGRANYMLKVSSDADAFLSDNSVTRSSLGLYNRRADDVGGLFDHSPVTYNKGGAVLHTLREQVGTEAFWKAVNIYLNRHKFGSVESTDLRQAMEEASGQDLSWFFEQWVYGAGSPSLDVKQSYSVSTKTLTLTIAQTQTPDVIVPAAFRLPMDLIIHTPGGDQKHTLDVTKRLQTFSFKTGAEPARIEIDKDNKIPLKRIKVRGLKVSK